MALENFTIAAEGITISLPDLSQITWWQWLLINAAYGLVTHFCSLPAIHAWNIDCPTFREQISDGAIFIVLLCRLFFNLPFRILGTVVGMLTTIGVFVSSGKLKSNSFLTWGWHWYLPPEKLRKIIDGF